jgi:hypothetical protein
VYGQGQPGHVEASHHDAGLRAVCTALEKGLGLLAAPALLSPYSLKCLEYEFSGVRMQNSA